MQIYMGHSVALHGHFANDDYIFLNKSHLFCVTFVAFRM